MVESGTIICGVNTTNTGGWQLFKTEYSASTPNLEVGMHTFMVNATGGRWNFNWMGFKFNADNQYSIDASVNNGGDIPPGGPITANEGATQSYAIEALDCYDLTDVIIDGVSQGIITSHTFSKITENHTISAVFAKKSISGKEIAKDVTINFIPNPADDYIVIGTEEFESGAVTLYTLTGKAVLSQVLNN